MSYTTAGYQGLSALDSRDWNVAVQKLSTALNASPNPAWFIGRSKAHVGLGIYREALRDAELAWNSACDRNKRELIIEANYRRAVAHFRLGEYANADCCCLYAMRMIKGESAVEKEDPGNAFTDENGFWNATVESTMCDINYDEINGKPLGPMDLTKLGQDGKSQANKQLWGMTGTLRAQSLNSMNKMPADHPSRKRTVKPDPPRPDQVNTTAEKSSEPGAAAGATKTTETGPARPPTFQTYQSESALTLTIFSKGVKKEQLKIGYSKRTIHLDPMVYSNGEEKSMVFEFNQDVNSDGTRLTVTPNKVEVSIKKTHPGKWDDPTLRSADDVWGPKPETSDHSPGHLPAQTIPDEEIYPPPKYPDRPACPSLVGSSAHKYPTSSRSGPKDWDKLDLGPEDDEDEGVDGFFKKLYKGATPEQQRAMMKSFTESSGTSLSTNWEDVKDRTVDAVPPEGVEAKKW